MWISREIWRSRLLWNKDFPFWEVSLYTSQKGAINNSTVEKLLLGGSMNHIKLIKNKQDHVKALARIKTLIDKNVMPDSKEADELEVLSLLIEHYEQKNFPIEKPDPIEAIKFRMERLGLLKKDLIPFIGSASKVTEVLNGTRQLSLNMIRKLSNGLGISVEILIGISKSNVGKSVALQKSSEHKRSKAA